MDQLTQDLATALLYTVSVAPFLVQKLKSKCRNMKNFFRRPKGPTSKQGSALTQELRSRYPEIFWTSNPNHYVAIWMKADFMAMEAIDFLAKYIGEMEEATTSVRRKIDIQSVILPMYREVTGRNYDTNYLAAFGIESAT